MTFLVGPSSVLGIVCLWVLCIQNEFDGVFLVYAILGTLSVGVSACFFVFIGYIADRLTDIQLLMEREKD